MDPADRDDQDAARSEHAAEMRDIAADEARAAAETFSSDEARDFFCSLTLAELRRRQSLCAQQQAIAYAACQRREPSAPAALDALAIMESDLTLAVGCVAGLWTVPE